MTSHKNQNHDNVEIHEMKFVISSDAKPKLKWSRELHRGFVKAIDRLGGAKNATPKSLMKTMGIDGLTLYHLKSHMQKYRMGNARQVVQTYSRVKREGKTRRNLTSKICDGDREALNGLGALQMEMEVQRKLDEQIEVERHLQVRIEAQGKYLQSILVKAQETVDPCSVKVEQAMVNSDRYLNSSLSVLTESEEGSISIIELYRRDADETKVKVDLEKII